MKTLSLSWFGFTMLTLVHAVSIPVTDDPVSPPEDGLVTHDYPDNPPTHDYTEDWMGGTDGDYHFGFTCPDGWTKHGTQCLLFVPQSLTWNEAKENCASKGLGSLASVYDDMQIHEIYTELESAGHHGGQVWVGGSKTSEDSSWSWEDSSFDGFATFCDEKSSHHEDNCLQISLDDHGSGCLKGTKCDAKLPSVCAILLY